MAPARGAVAALALMMLVVAASPAAAQPQSQQPPGPRGPDQTTLTVQFDNRGVKVEGKIKQITAAIADCVCDVPASQVKYLSTLGQSTLTNHQSVSTYECTGPTRSGKPVLQACKENVRGGLLSSSRAYQCIRRYTNTWALGDAVNVQKAQCAAPGARSG